MNDSTIIKPLKSVLKINKILIIVSFCFCLNIFFGILTNDNKILLSIEFTIFFIFFIYEIIKKNKLKHSIYVLKDNIILINNNSYNLKDLSGNLDKHGNLILNYNNKKIIKINRLTYNFDMLKDKFIKNQDKVN